MATGKANTPAAAAPTAPAPAAAEDQNQGVAQGDGDGGAAVEGDGGADQGAAATEAPAQTRKVRPDAAVTPAAGGRNPREPLPKLLVKACEIFGVNPDPDALVKYPNPSPGVRAPKAEPELLNYKMYPGSAETGEPDAVCIVTAAGVKLKYFADDSVDQATDDTLRRIFRAFKTGPDGAILAQPLPSDWTLPSNAVRGVPGGDHQYARGYLKEGGKTEADRREDEQQRSRRTPRVPR